MSKKSGRVLSNRSIVISAALVVLLAAGAAWLLLANFGGGSEADRARLDAIRTVGSLVLGAGGAIALLLAARRQQTAERDLAQKEQVQRHAEQDAAERRFMGTKFADRASFAEVKFPEGAFFAATKFEGDAWFRETVFAGDADFSEAEFARDAEFTDFASNVTFESAWARTDVADVSVSLPSGWTVSDDAGERPDRPGTWARVVSHSSGAGA